MNTKTLENVVPAFEVVQKNQPLHDSVRQSLENYLSQLKGQELPSDLYEKILREIEAPLIEAVMAFTKNNQSRAAILLGLSRGTLRKKLKLYGLLD
jgi:Fis family transcriptional regulator